MSAELVSSAVAALRAGRPAEARGLFERATAGGAADAATWLGLAFACKLLGDAAGREAAVDRALALEPGNVRALAAKGELRDAAGDGRRATAFHRAALRVGAGLERPPPDVVADLERARAALDRHAAAYEAHLRRNLAERGRPVEAAAPRVRRAMDIMLGRSRPYLQEPRFFYFPGLPQVGFHPREAFPWLNGVEAAAAAIRAELDGVLADHALFTPYVQGRRDLPGGDQGGMADNPDWSAFYLVRGGEPTPEGWARCPRTLAALDDVPLYRVKGRSPNVLFSLLRPGAHIPAHTGFVNTRLIAHLGLITPEGCRFRVGDEVRTWREGEALVFDDTIEHEVWNDSGETRVVLIFDVEHPSMTPEETAGVAALFESVDAYGAGVSWED